MYLFLFGVGLVATILGLFWLKDRLQSPVLARIALSEPVARLAVVGVAFIVLGLLLFLSDFGASVLE
jgi:hypothetical protein